MPPSSGTPHAPSPAAPSSASAGPERERTGHRELPSSPSHPFFRPVNRQVLSWPNVNLLLIQSRRIILCFSGENTTCIQRAIKNRLAVIQDEDAIMQCMMNFQVISNSSTQTASERSVRVACKQQGTSRRGYLRAGRCAPSSNIPHSPSPAALSDSPMCPERTGHRALPSSPSHSGFGQMS